MSASLKEFTRRAVEADKKLYALETQLNALTFPSLPSPSKQSKDNKPEWELVYWPIRNRGNFVRLIFEEADVPYKYIHDIEEVKTQVRSNVMGNQTRTQGGTYQAMAPPFIRNGDFMLSQSIVCMDYLSQKFGIRPRSEEDHARAQMIGRNCDDIITEIYSYQRKTKQEVLQYINGRFQIWLDILENPLKRTHLAYYFENRCTQADLAVFTLLDGVEELFGLDSFDKYVVKTHKYLVDYYNHLKQRKSIQRLMEKQKGMYTYDPRFGWAAMRKILRE
eukprot:213299_1